MRVCIDPGHGGNDPGAIGNGYYEKVLTLKVSLELRKILIDNGIDVIMTRETDEHITDDTRINKVINSRADICLSIHFNAANGNGKGTETIFQINNEKSKELSEYILDSISTLGIKKRSAYSKVSQKNPNSDYYFMLRRTRPINTVIVECLFIDNSKDIEFIKEENSINRLADSIAKGILKYFGVLEKEKNVIPNWEKPNLDKLKELGLIKNEHNPSDIPTWGELATMIVRTIEYVENNYKKLS